MLPQNLKYQPKVESAPARRYRTNIQPQNGQNGYTGSNTIIINIPTRNNTALVASESVLKFTASLPAPAGACTIQSFESCGYHGFINRLRVFHGSNLLQDIQEYHQLAKILFDFQMPNDSVAGRLAVGAGTNDTFSGVGETADAATAVTVRAVNRGRSLTTGTVAGQTSAITVNCAINLISLVGALAGNKYLPLWEMTSAPLRVELVLQDNIFRVMNYATTNAPNGTFTLNNVEYIGEFLELPDSAIGAIKAGSSSPLQMVIPDWRAYTFSQQLQTSQTTLSMPIPAKFSSLKSIVINQRASTGATGFYPAASGRFGLSQYQVRVGSETLPSNPPTVLADMFNEACKCFGSIADIAYQPSIDLTSYAPDEALTVVPGTGLFQASYNIAGANALPVALTTYTAGQNNNSGSFLVGIDLESYMSADKSSIFAGMNTNTSDIFYQPTYIPMSAATVINLTAFACYDSVLVCESGVAYTRF